MSFRRKNKFSRNQGLTLIETVVAMAILGILSGALVSAIGQYNTQRDRIVTLGSRDVQIAGLVENIRSNLQFFQASYEDFSRSASVQSIDVLMPNRQSLPLVWSSDGAISNPEECPHCEGRMGILIQPISNFSAPLFVITLRVSHPEVSAGALVDYRFMAAFKD